MVSNHLGVVELSEHKHDEEKVCRICGEKIGDGEKTLKYYCMKCFKDRGESIIEKKR